MNHDKTTSMTLSELFDAQKAGRRFAFMGNAFTVEKMGGGQFRADVTVGIISGPGETILSAFDELAETPEGSRDYTLIWSPEGRPLGVVTAKDPKAAKRKAPLPFRKFLGEIGVEEGARPGVKRL